MDSKNKLSLTINSIRDYTVPLSYRKFTNNKVLLEFRKTAVISIFSGSYSVSIVIVKGHENKGLTRYQTTEF